MSNIKQIQIGSTTYDIALKNPLYHSFAANTNYYDSYSGTNMFRIITENMFADTFRYQSSTLSDIEYYDYDNSAWATSTLSLVNLFDGDARTGISVPYAQRKFRFCITSTSGWPTTCLFLLQCSWWNSGTIGSSTNVTIETRANTSSDWVTKESFSFTTSPMGANARGLGNLHTGHTLYRVTIEFPTWTSTSNSIPLKRICMFSNYGGGALENLSYDGYGNATLGTKKITAGDTSFTKINGVSSPALTDTKNTAGSSDTSSKIYLVGATSQATNPQTYSHDTVYVDTAGCLNSSTPSSTDSSTKVATTAFVAAAIGDAIADSY